MLHIGQLLEKWWFWASRRDADSLVLCTEQEGKKG